MSNLGLRVIRGKDWNYGNQDGGKGHLGTVVEIKDSDKSVTVRWDIGSVHNYRAGKENAYDLRVYDNAQTGIKHQSVQCDECQECPVVGMRWKCVECSDFDLCTNCYMNENTHNKSHSFLRIATETSERSDNDFPLRFKSLKISVNGIFPGATVVPGTDWNSSQNRVKWAQGTVVSLETWEDCPRASVLVKPDAISAFVNILRGIESTSTRYPAHCRLGYEGKVDVKYVKFASGGNVYIEHLPHLGLEYSTARKITKISSSDVDFCLGGMAAILMMDKHYQQKKLADENKAREKAFIEFAVVTYKENMEKIFAQPESVPSDKLKHYHQEAFRTAIEIVSKARPLTLEVTNKIQAEVETQYQEYKNFNDIKVGSRAPVIGIDLGTTHSCLAVSRDNKLEIIVNNLDLTTTPSYIAFKDDEIVVGETAKQQAYLHPDSTIYDVKRICGRHFSDPWITKFKQFWPFKIVEDTDGKINILVKGKPMAPEDVITHLVQYLKSTADTFIGMPIVNAVVTVPAYFNARQKTLTKEACRKAGLNVLQFISEPVAAAVAYGLQNRNESKTCFVFDLGGGTLDVTILELNRNNFRIRAIDGDSYLGGEDFDNAMMEYCLKDFKRLHNVDLLMEGSSEVRARRKSRIKMKCEEHKCFLATARSTKLTIDSIYKDQSLEVTFTREILKDIANPQLESCLKVVDDVLKTSGLTEKDIDDVMLVGGSSRLICVQEMLVKKFDGKTLLKKINPDEAIARGAAIVASNLGKDSNRTFKALEDILQGKDSSILKL